MGQVLTDVKLEFILSGLGAVAQHNERMRRLAPFLVGHAHDSHFLHRRVPQQAALDLH